MDWKANFKHVFQVVFLNCMFCFSKGDLNHCYWWRFVLSELCFTLCVVLLVSERDNQVEAELDQKSQEHHAIHSQQDNPIHQGTPIQSAPTASIPPPAVIHAVPPPPLPNQVLPNMVAVLPGLPPFNTNQLTHLPLPRPLSPHTCHHRCWALGRYHHRPTHSLQLWSRRSRYELVWCVCVICIHVLWAPF